MTSLREAGVQTSIHYPPTHRFTAYASTLTGAAVLPRTDAAFERLLTLPLGPSMTRAQVDLVLDARSGRLAAVAVRWGGSRSSGRSRMEGGLLSQSGSGAAQRAAKGTFVSMSVEAAASMCARSCTRTRPV